MSGVPRWGPEHDRAEIARERATPVQREAARAVAAGSGQNPGAGWGGGKLKSWKTEKLNPDRTCQYFMISLAWVRRLRHGAGHHECLLRSVSRSSVNGGRCTFGAGLYFLVRPDVAIPDRKKGQSMKFYLLRDKYMTVTFVHSYTNQPDQLTHLLIFH